MAIHIKNLLTRLLRCILLLDMNIKQTVKTLALGMTLLIGMVVFLAPTALAAEKCGGVDTAIIKCDEDGSGGVENTGAWGILLLAINILTGGIGIVAVAGIVYASILYASAGGNPEQTKKAMGMITNIVIGVLTFALMYALLNFIIPGGLF